MDLAALEAELQELRREKFEAKQRLDAQRGPMGGPSPMAFKDRPLGQPASDLPGSRGRIPPPPFGTAAPGSRGGPSLRDGPPRDGYGYGGARDGAAGGPRGPMGGPLRGRMEPAPGPGGRMGLRGLAAGTVGLGTVSRGELPPPNGRDAVVGPPPRRGRPPSDHDDRDRGSRFNNGGLPFRGSRDDVPLEVPPVAPRKRLLSSVVVKDGTRASEEPEEPGSARGTKRSAPEAGDDAGGGGGGEEEGQRANGDAAGARKRNRRMFGALLGTLAKFREEDASFQASDVAVRRLEAQRKAEERERQQSEALRRREYEQRQQRRDEELQRLGELSLATDTKLLELMFMKRIARKQALSNFICTKSHPPLHWMPAMPSPATDALLQEQKDKFEEWKVGTLEELEVEKEALRKRSEERRATALAKRAERLAARGLSTGAAAGAAKGEDDGEDADMVEQQELEAGEYAGHDEVKHEQEEQEAQPGQQQGETAGAEPMDEEEGGRHRQQQQPQPQPRTQPGGAKQARSSRPLGGGGGGGGDAEEGERVAATKREAGSRGRAAAAPAGSRGGMQQQQEEEDDRYQGGHEHGEEEQEEGERPRAAEEEGHKGRPHKGVGHRQSGVAEGGEKEDEGMDVEDMAGLRDLQAATVEDLLS